MSLLTDRAWKAKYKSGRRLLVGDHDWHREPHVITSSHLMRRPASSADLLATLESLAIVAEAAGRRRNRVFVAREILAFMGRGFESGPSSATGLQT